MRQRDEVSDGPTPAIVAEQVGKSFDDHVVLRDVDLTIRHGEIVAVVGGSGCGKTVLLDILVGLLAPDGGRVLIANHSAPGAPLVDLTTAHEHVIDDIRRHWAIVFQHNALFSGTVYENIALWLAEVGGLSDAEIRPRVERVVAAVGLDPARVLDEDREDLSGGMAKRVAIARALAMDPALIFYDEPTTGLDPEQAGRIQELISTTHWRPTADDDTRTTLIITHDKDLLRRLAPRVIMLNDGGVLFDGPYAGFADSDSPAIRPYVELMAVLHHGARA